MITRLIGLVLATTSIAASFAEEVTIYLDEYGVPHIYAKTEEAGLFADGWAQAHDRLRQILDNFARAMGKYAECFGAGEKDANLRSDLEVLMWDHYGTAKKFYDEKLPPEFRKHNAAYIAGINRYMDEHPDEVPAWWTYGDVDVYMPVAFSRQYIWSWPLGEASGDLQRIGLKTEFDIDFRYSNEMAVAPSRSADGHAMLVIDPHLGWFGRQRYWEVRIHAGELQLSGFATAGFPYVSLGHNDHVAWAHTTGGPDTADVYELRLNPKDPLEYLYDGEYHPLQTRNVSISVKGEAAPREVTFYSSHHGPIVARNGNLAYAAKLSYADEIGYLESRRRFAISHNVAEVREGLEVLQVMPQNVMVADTNGDIYYQRTGRVPIRPAGFDFSRPVNGSTSRTEWLGLHPTKDLIQVLNPKSGYMQNCNITPDVMMVGSPMEKSLYPDYIFGQPAMLTHQRGTRATELLHTNSKITEQQMMEIALDQKSYQYEHWIEELENADTAIHGEWSKDYDDAFKRIKAWDGFARRESNGALVYYYWRHALAELAGKDGIAAMIKKVNNYLDLFGVPDDRSHLAKLGDAHTPTNELARINEDEQRLLVEALEKGAAQMRANHGSLDAVYGDVFRAGRLDYDGDNVSFPVGGGSLRDEGMASPRAIDFENEREDHTRWGRGGQTSTEVVVLSTPIRSYTQPPIGQSDHPDSPHFRDQAEQLLGPAKMKPSWFSKDELMNGHVQETIVLQF